LLSLLNGNLNIQVALPLASYLIRYFDEQADLALVGAPVYFVVKDRYGYEYGGRIHQNAICAIGKDKSRRKPQSLVNTIAIKAHIPKESYICDEYVLDLF